MSSSKTKKVHYERGTKGGKSESRGHRSTNSRDSGVGSSSASDRASLGSSTYDDLPFSYQQIEDQSRSLRAVQEALAAANEKIRHWEAMNSKLDASLFESNRENRLLRREKTDLLDKVRDLIKDLEDERNRNRRDSTPRSGAGAPSGASSSRTERRTTPPRREEPRSHRRDDERSQGSHGESRRTSYMPSASQPPPNSAPNPFTPISPISSTPAPSLSSYAQTPISPTVRPSVVYSVGQVSFAQAPITYTTAPSIASPRSTTSDRFPNDGLYHPYPL